MRKKKHPEHVNHERWLVSYADFITLLFAFFTTMYAISTVDQSKAGKLVYSMRTAFNVELFQTSAPPRPTSVIRVVEGFLAGIGDKQAQGRRQLGKMERKLKDLADEPALRGRFQVRMEARGLVVSLVEAGFFESGSATIKHEAFETMAVLADIVIRSGVTVTVEGHTDNVPVRRGRFQTNWDLSTARATAVVALFIEKGVPPERLSAAGYGEYKPVASNDRPEGRSHNRRVDIVIAPLAIELPEASGLTSPASPSPVSL